MPCHYKKNNNAEEDQELVPERERLTLKKAYNKTESFLYRNRWWIVLILAVLLAYYLYSQRVEASLQTATPRILSNELNVASPQEGGFDTVTRTLFRL